VAQPTRATRSAARRWDSVSASIEVPQPLHLRQVEPATLVRATRELACGGGAAPRDARKGSENRADDRAPSVHV
jgi:hypothetical protein